MVPPHPWRQMAYVGRQRRKPLLYLRLVQHLAQVGVDLLHDVVRSACEGEERKPAPRVEAGDGSATAGRSG